jgi:8-oxo-dGTP pyrophosphatase MutT (NUDIX family)
VSGAPRESAVLVPLHRGADGTWRLVVVRRSDGGVHGGQLAFPGGAACDADGSLAETALREAEEEIGLPRDGVRLLAELPAVETRVSNFRITPYLAVVTPPAAWAPDPREIAEVLEVRLAKLLEPGARDFAPDLLPAAAGEVRLPFYSVGPHRLWGASERILNGLLARVAAGEWPELREM